MQGLKIKKVPHIPLSFKKNKGKGVKCPIGTLRENTNNRNLHPWRVSSSSHRGHQTLDHCPTSPG